MGLIIGMFHGTISLVSFEPDKRINYRSSCIETNIIAMDNRPILP